MPDDDRVSTPHGRPEPRISNADRDQAVERLNQAMAEGRLDVSEFDERVAGVLQSRTASELVPYLADLPGALAPSVTAPEHQELRATMSSVERKGRWVVPRRLSLHSKAGSIKLDLTEALIYHPVIEVVVQSTAGSTTLIVPDRTSVNADQVELVASSTKVRGVTTATDPIGTPHLVISGRQLAGSLVVRRQRRFLWWRW